jgi:hypothetical protein
MGGGTEEVIDLLRWVMGIETVIKRKFKEIQSTDGDVTT